MNENCQPKGIPAGGQFAADVHTEQDVAISAPPALDVQDGPGHDVAWDSPEDQERFRAAAAFMDETGITGAVKPYYTKYRTDDDLDALALYTDGRRFTVHHAGTRHPHVIYEDNDDGSWSFQREAGDAWRRDEETFKHGDGAEVVDFNVRYDQDGVRVIALDVDRDGRLYELTQRGAEEFEIVLDGGKPLPLPQVQLDALVLEFDEDHTEGTGDLVFKFMMKDTAHRVWKNPGFDPWGTDRP